MPRVLLLTGKGGVGKTTTAAATALRCAALGHRTLVLSTDPAHSLADAFGVPLGPKPSTVAPKLAGQQLDAQARLEASWKELRTFLSALFQWVGVQAIEAEELSMLPGLDEVFALGDLREHLDSGLYDVIVVDCAPTAETLRFLTLPEVLSWWMDRLFPLTRQVTKLVGPALSFSTSLPIPDANVFDALQRFYDRIDGVRHVLADPVQTSVRLVVNPERMVIAEARRTYTYLSLFGYRVDAVVANRMLPPDVTDPWFDEWKVTQQAHLAEIETAFAPLPVLRAALAPRELVGADALEAFGQELYGDRDPSVAMHDGSPMQVSQRDGAWVLVVELPFAEKDRGRVEPQGRRAVCHHRRPPPRDPVTRLSPPASGGRCGRRLRSARGRVRGAGMNGGEMSSEPSEAIGHLQAAALEMISAARAFLEVAEKVVQNPETVRSAVVTVASLAKAVMQSVDNGGPPSGETTTGTNGDDPQSAGGAHRAVMKFTELRTPDGRPLHLHPRFAVIEANEETRGQVLTALRNAMRPGGSAAGYVEVHGVLLDFDRETLRLLDLDPAPALVLEPADIPIEAFGPAARRRPTADDVAAKHLDLVDAHRQEVQGALEVVDALQVALRAATDERDRAAGASRGRERSARRRDRVARGHVPGCRVAR